MSTEEKARGGLEVEAGTFQVTQEHLASEGEVPHPNPEHVTSTGGWCRAGSAGGQPPAQCASGLPACPGLSHIAT